MHLAHTVNSPTAWTVFSRITVQIWFFRLGPNLLINLRGNRAGQMVFVVDIPFPRVLQMTLTHLMKEARLIGQFFMGRI